jgi:hypothetical protein
MSLSFPPPEKGLAVNRFRQERRRAASLTHLFAQNFGFTPSCSPLPSAKLA